MERALTTASYEHDGQGRVIRATEDDGSWTEYRYGDDGFVREYIYSSDGSPGGYYERWYDENGDILRQYIYEYDG